MSSIISTLLLLGLQAVSYFPFIYHTVASSHRLTGRQLRVATSKELFLPCQACYSFYTLVTNEALTSIATYVEELSGCVIMNFTISSLPRQLLTRPPMNTSVQAVLLSICQSLSHSLIPPPPPTLIRRPFPYLRKLVLFKVAEVFIFLTGECTLQSDIHNIYTSQIWHVCGTLTIPPTLY